MEVKPTIVYDDFAKVDLRVATVTAAELHPNADRLLKLQVDLGFETRQICAGIKGHYDPQQLIGKQVIVVANLQPRTIRGEPSNGMLLAASVRDHEETQELVLLTPDRAIAAGATVS